MGDFAFQVAVNQLWVFLYTSTGAIQGAEVYLLTRFLVLNAAVWCGGQCDRLALGLRRPGFKFLLPEFHRNVYLIYLEICSRIAIDQV